MIIFREGGGQKFSTVPSRGGRSKISLNIHTRQSRWRGRHANWFCPPPTSDVAVVKDMIVRFTITGLIALP